MVSECRVAGLDVHALADAFNEPALLPAPDAPEVVDGKRGPESVADDASATIPAPAATSSTRHRLKRRTDPLAAVLAEAKRLALDQADWQSVWASLVELAKSVNRPPPLIGYTESEGVKYQTDNDQEPVRWFTRESCRQRFKRLVQSQSVASGRERSKP